MVELLAPASNLDKLKLAINSGADAVYIGGEIFGTDVEKFSIKDIEEGVKFAHNKNKKVYVNISLIPHNKDFDALDKYLVDLEKCSVDAFIIGDVGVLSHIKKVTPNMKIHINDQANITNYLTANFWFEQGINRVNLAKELSLEEIAKIRAKTPLELELEILAHGEMIISYSKRSLISSFMKGKKFDKQYDFKDETLKYSLMEEKRPGEYYPVYEDVGGTFLFNSKDLCMINNIEDIIKSGVKVLRIEARKKSDEYLETVIKSYRNAIDKFYENKKEYKINPKWSEEIKNATHREFTTGFYLDRH